MRHHLHAIPEDQVVNGGVSRLTALVVSEILCLEQNPGGGSTASGRHIPRRPAEFAPISKQSEVICIQSPFRNHGKIDFESSCAVTVEKNSSKIGRLLPPSDSVIHPRTRAETEPGYAGKLRGKEIRLTQGRPFKIVLTTSYLSSSPDGTTCA
jgi:hypothetical protein